MCFNQTLHSVLWQSLPLLLFSIPFQYWLYLFISIQIFFPWCIICIFFVLTLCIFFLLQRFQSLILLENPTLSSLHPHLSRYLYAINHRETSKGSNCMSPQVNISTSNPQQLEMGMVNWSMLIGKACLFNTNTRMTPQPKRRAPCEFLVHFPPLSHGWVRICLHCQVTHWPITLMHIDCDNSSPFPAGHGGTNTEFWTDAISVAYRATSASELCHAPGEKQCAWWDLCLIKKNLSFTADLHTEEALLDFQILWDYVKVSSMWQLWTSQNRNNILRWYSDAWFGFTWLPLSLALISHGVWVYIECWPSLKTIGY